VPKIESLLAVGHARSAAAWKLVQCCSVFHCARNIHVHM